MEKKTPLKRPYMDTDSDSDSDTWPRFLILESTDPQQPLHKLSPFAINKGIVGIAGQPENVKKLRSGQLLVEVSKKSHSNNLQQCKMLAQVPVKCFPHKSLNTKKGVIRCPDLKFCTDEEVLDELSSQRVVHLKRIIVTRNGEKKSTGTFIVTFNSSSLPKTITVGYLKVKVDPYIPNPIRCFKCQQYGHFNSVCKHSEVCAKCGKDDHTNSQECTNTPNCVNCSGDHAANSRDCPKWQEEKSIQKLKYENNISYPEAKRQLQASQAKPGTISYAQSVVAKKVQQKSIAVQTDVTWPVSSSTPQKLDTVKNKATAIPGKSVQTEDTKNQSQNNKTSEKSKTIKVKGAVSERLPKGTNKYEALQSLGDSDMEVDQFLQKPNTGGRITLKSK